MIRRQGRMASDEQPRPTEREIIDQAERTLALQAAISLDEASGRIRLYARFRDLRLVDVCQAILSDTVHLLTMRENENLARRTD
jgi:ANTAR domain